MNISGTVDLVTFFLRLCPLNNLWPYLHYRLITAIYRELVDKYPSPHTCLLLGDAYMSIQEVGNWKTLMKFKWTRWHHKSIFLLCSAILGFHFDLCSYMVWEFVYCKYLEMNNPWVAWLLLMVDVHLCVCVHASTYHTCTCSRFWIDSVRCLLF